MQRCISTREMEDEKQLKFSSAIDPDFRNLIETGIKMNVRIGLSYTDKKLHRTYKIEMQKIKVTYPPCLKEHKAMPFKQVQILIVLGRTFII